MAGDNHILKPFHSARQKDSSASVNEDQAELAALMSDADYLRQSSSLINEALQKGFDVLQLANGDIVTTGTKTIVYTYSWDKEKSKLIREKSSEKKSRAKKDEFFDESLYD